MNFLATSMESSTQALSFFLSLSLYVQGGWVGNRELNQVGKRITFEGLSINLVCFAPTTQMKRHRAPSESPSRTPVGHIRSLQSPKLQRRGCAPSPASCELLRCNAWWVGGFSAFAGTSLVYVKIVLTIRTSE